MKAIVLGYHNIGCVGIRALARHGIEIAALFTHPDDPHEALWFASASEVAASMGIMVYAPEDINHPLWLERIRALRPDILFSFYYRKMLKPALLEIPASGCYNLHGSLLPKYRGKCPINWVLVNGEKETGVTLHHMTAKPDDGDIVDQERILIDDQDTAQSLHHKAAAAAEVLLDRVLPALKSGTAPRRRQEAGEATYFGGRGPADGEIDWHRSATAVRNLVRAVTRPYPGAFSFVGDRKCFFWQVTVLPQTALGKKPGVILSRSPLVIACGEGAIQVEFGQSDKGVYIRGTQLAEELNLYPEMRFGASSRSQMESSRKQRVLILGINGFIGNALSERLLAGGKYEIHGMDLYSDGIRRFLNHPGFHFVEGDISIHREWLEYHIRKCDIIIPLVAIATPIEYTRNPLRVFELDFEENLRIVRYCVKYRKRIIFPSTSEVYGMCEDPEFDEDHSKLVLGPISMQRWIYSCSKQLLDRVIWAYGQQQGLQFTLIRPFNWIGPRLDSLSSARIGSSRAITQLILNLVEGSPIKLIDGGQQKRCFTDVADGIECLYRIIENRDRVCDGKIFNIGNPDNELSIRELAQALVTEFDRHPNRAEFPPFAGYKEVESANYYGAGYQDVQHRSPSIRNARRWLGWQPAIGIQQSVRETLNYFIDDYLGSSAPAILNTKSSSLRISA